MKGKPKGNDCAGFIIRKGEVATSVPNMFYSAHVIVGVFDPDIEVIWLDPEAASAAAEDFPEGVREIRLRQFAQEIGGIIVIMDGQCTDWHTFESEFGSIGVLDLVDFVCENKSMLQQYQ